MTFYAELDRDVITDAELEQQRKWADEAQADFLRAKLAVIAPGFKSKYFYARLVEHIKNDSDAFGCTGKSERREMVGLLECCESDLRGVGE